MTALRKKSGPKPVKRSALDSVERDIIEDFRAGYGYRYVAEKNRVSLTTLWEWVSSDNERYNACARAREESADQCDEEALQAIEEAADPFELAKARELAIHMRWRAKVRNPKRYGDRIQTEITGELSVKKSAADMTDEELAAIAARKQDKPSAKAPKTPVKTAKTGTKRASKP